MEQAVLLSGKGGLDRILPVGMRANQSRDPFADCPSLEEIQRRYIDYISRKTGEKVAELAAPPNYWE